MTLDHALTTRTRAGRRRLAGRTVPFLACFAAILLLLLLPHPGVEYHLAFVWAGTAFIALLAVAAAVVPWDRFNVHWEAVIPLAAFLGIALIRHGSGAGRSGMTSLLLLPTFWIALYGSRAAMAGAVLFCGSAFIVPPLLLGEPLYPVTDIPRGVGLAVVVSVIGVVVQSLVVRERRRSQDLAEAQRRQTALTEEARETNTLLDAQRRFTRLITDTADVGIVACDVDGRLTFLNRPMRELLRLHADVDPGGLQIAATPAFEVDGTTSRAPELMPLSRAVRGEEVRDDEIVLYPDGTDRPVWLSASALPLHDDDGRIVGAVASVRDVTERVAAERELQEARDRLAAVVDAVTEQAIIGTNSEGVITLFNRGAERMIGVPASEALGLATIGQWHLPSEIDERAEAMGIRTPPGPARAADVLLATARGGRSETREWTLVRPDGEHVDVEVSVTQKIGANGELRGYLGVFSDVTARHAADRLKDEFIALVSHELRTPLSSIIGYLEILLEEEDGDEPGALDPSQRQFLGVIDRNARRLLRLVGDLLFTAQVGAGTVTLQRSPTDVPDLVRNAVEAVRPRAANGDIALQVDVADVPSADLDAERIGQAIDNLVGNAVKFTPAGGTVTVRLYTGAGTPGTPGTSCDTDDTDETSTDADGTLVIEVQDTGIGIAPEAQDSVFDRFFRTQEVTVAAIPGIGLGLAISQAIAQAHGGSLVLVRSSAAGTTFRLSLPVRVPATLG